MPRTRFLFALLGALVLLLGANIRVAQAQQSDGPGIIMQFGPPPHVQECTNEVAVYGQFVVFRLAGVTREELDTNIAITMKVVAWGLTQPGNEAEVEEPEKEQMIRGFAAEIYDMDAAEFDAAFKESGPRTAVLRAKFAKCVAERAPADAPAPRDERDQQRMLPSA